MEMDSRLDWPLLEPVSAVKELVICCCYLDSTLVAKILKSVKALKMFDYEYEEPAQQSRELWNDEMLWTNHVWADI
jgi:hypothetical protein